MSRSDEERFADIIDAIDRCQQYAPYLRSQEHAAMAYDAVLRNLAVIGEAVRSLSPETRTRIPDVGTGARIGDNDSVVPWGAAGEDVHHAQAVPQGVPPERDRGGSRS